MPGDLKMLPNPVADHTLPAQYTTYYVQDFRV